MEPLWYRSHKRATEVCGGIALPIADLEPKGEPGTEDWEDRWTATILMLVTKTILGLHSPEELADGIRKCIRGIQVDIEEAIRE